MKTTRARRMPRAALLAVSAVGVAATLLTVDTAADGDKSVLPARADE